MSNAGGVGILRLDGHGDLVLERADGGVALDLARAINRAFDAVVETMS